MEFHSQEEQLQRFRTRLAVAATFVLVCFILLLSRLLYLQVVQYSYFDTRAEDNRISLLPAVPPRGIILDRNGVVLARNYSAYTLEITPSKVDDLEATIEALSLIVAIEPRDRRRFKRLMDESRNFDSVPIRTRLTDEEVARFTAQRYRFPGVDIRARLFRQYPEGELAAHAIGYIGRISARDQAQIDEDEEMASNYLGTQHMGKTGLEQSYERELHGTVGFEEMEVNAAGRVIRQLRKSPPVAGNNLILSLDSKLQKIAEDAFGKRRGALVAIDPNNGDILAFVSMPTYDPNLFVDGIAQQDWEELNTHPDKPLLNRALRSAYPPGSTFKPFMALGALTTGKRTPQQAISDPGFFNFGGHTFNDDKKGGHGYVNMYRSIVDSCDTYYYILANDMGIDLIASFMSQFNFGSLTGIDLLHEAKGVLPSPEWKQRRFKKPEQQRWYAGETISIGIGQGYNAYTPLQLAHATATLANGGTVYQPHLVKYIQNAQTGEKTPVAAQEVSRLPLKPEHIAEVRRGMVGVNTEGTGAKIFAGAGYSVAGKTGTAQVFSLKGAKYNASATREHLRDHAWYIAFAPADAPKIALAVIVENGGFGAQSAAPIARQVLDYWLLGKPQKGAAPVDESNTEGHDEESGGSKASHPSLPAQEESSSDE